jgi:hypothetical protein
MVFLLAVFGRKVYWFKLLFELSLNSGYDYLRRVWFIIGRNFFLAITQIDPFPTANLYIPSSRWRIQPPHS